MLVRLQSGLERLYRIETRVCVSDFVIDGRARQALKLARNPREQLLLSHDGHELSIGLYVDEIALANLTKNDPARRLSRDNLQDFLLVIEGVSHFVYVAWRARADRAVSALELELQAEVDKYVTCLLIHRPTTRASKQLRGALFEDVVLDADLSATERERYRAANDHANRFCAVLERRYLSHHRVCDMLGELRHFYRMSLAGKLHHIRTAH